MFFHKIIDNLINIYKNFERQIKNSSWLFFDSISKNVFNFISVIFVARYLGPEKYGLLSYAMGFVGMFTSLITLGLDGITVRELSKNNENKSNQILGSAYILKLLGYLLMLLIISLSILMFGKNSGDSTELIFIITIAYFFHTIFTIDYYFQAHLLSKKTVIATQIGILTGFIFKIISVYLKLDLKFFAIAFLIESSSIALLLMISYQKIKPLKKLKFDLKTAKVLLFSSLPIVISGLIYSFFRRFDQIMVQNLLGSIDNGYYSVAKKISESIYFIPSAISISLFPTLVKFRDNQEKLKKILIQTSAITLSASILIVVTIFLTSDWIIPIVFGKEYLKSAILLKISSLAIPFVFIDSINTKILLINNQQKYLIYSSFFGLIITVFLNKLLLTKIGVTGASISYFLAWFFGSFIIFIIIPSTRENIINQIKSILFIPKIVKKIIFKELNENIF